MFIIINNRIIRKVMPRVLGMGNALVDILIRLDNDELLKEFKLPKGSMQLVDQAFARKLQERASKKETIKASGGSAANTIHGLAELNIETGFIGKVGNDMMGKFFKKDLEKAGIEPALFYGKSDTGVAVTLITPDSERTFAVYLGAAMEQAPEDISNELFRGYEYFHIEGYLVQNHELIETALKFAKNQNTKVSLDLASYNVVEENIEFLKFIVPEYVDIIFANEEEARAFTGKGPVDALKELAEITEIAVVKIGERGSFIRKGGEFCEIGIIDAKSIDTTGAGDLYASGFLYGLIRKLSLKQCGELGALLSGKVIENIGGKIHRNTWNELKKFYKEISYPFNSLTDSMK
jgi:sugar/nucleoside kinase (ribokinase family)